MYPPPLAWISQFKDSVAVAIDGGIQDKLEKTINPLVFRVKFKFNQPIQGKNMQLIWNLFQIFAAHNDVVPKGKVRSEDQVLEVEVIIKRRLGLPREDHPVG